MNLFGVGAPEIFVVLIVVLVLFGPERLPELARKIGGASRELRGTLDSLNDQMNNALEASMELDKARMIPPEETPSETNSNSTPPETFEVGDEEHRTRHSNVAKDDSTPPASPS